MLAKREKKEIFVRKLIEVFDGIYCCINDEHVRYRCPQMDALGGCPFRAGSNSPPVSKIKRSKLCYKAEVKKFS